MWKWKAKDGTVSTLLYEPGNWGDLLKLGWAATLARWRMEREPFAYFDPFAGARTYPLSAGARVRWARCGLPGPDLGRWLQQDQWPSTAEVVRTLTGCPAEVFDADADRRQSWAGSGAVVLDGTDAWQLSMARPAVPGEIWLVDPYDFLADWRQNLHVLLDKARTVSIVLYVYNRSAGKKEAFADYRAFVNKLTDGRGSLPRCLGRVPSDGFLPRAHHEMLFLPGAADAARPGFAALVRSLDECTRLVADAVRRSAEFSEFFTPGN